jgi:predicted double-glycine peptidase
MIEAIYLFLLSILNIPNPVPASQVIPITPTPTILISSPSPIPDSKILVSNYHVFQTFNNCGPAALSMALSYYDVNISQQILGQELRPYQNPQGDNDDKSVTLEELANYVQAKGFSAYHRPLGNIEILKKLISAGYPVITRTWLKANDDIGHYRVVKGYDNNVLIQDDSLQGKNIHYSTKEFNEIWNKFNFEYLVFVHPDKKAEIEQLLGPFVDPEVAWKQAAISSTGLNKSVALFHTRNYRDSVTEFELIESSLPMRALWYQIEPIISYYKLGDFDRVFEITDKILNNHNRAFSELYIIRGKVYEIRNQKELSQQQYDLAKRYNSQISIENFLEKLN